MKRKLLVGLLLVSLVLAGSTVAALATEDLLQTILERGELIVGTAAGYAPFQMLCPAGEVIGFDMDIARFFADSLGVDLRIVNVDWAGIIPGLLVGHYDIIMSGMTATLERALRVQFTKPYFRTGQAALINRELLPNITSLEELNRPDIVISVSLGTTGHFAAERAFPLATIRTLTAVEAATEVVLGRAHAMIFDEPFVRRYVLTEPELVYTIDEVLTAEYLAFAVRMEGTTNFLRWLDLAVFQLKEVTLVDEELMERFALDPKFLGKSLYDALYHKWFIVWLKGKGA